MIFVISIIITSSVSVFATMKYKASEVEYNGKTVEVALNDLYSKYSFGELTHIKTESKEEQNLRQRLSEVKSVENRGYSI